MAESAVLRKLHMKSGQKVAVVGAPEDVRPAVTAVPEGVDLSERLDGHFDFILCFVKTKAEVHQLAPSLKEAMKPGAVLWIAYPKGRGLSTDLNRDILREQLAASRLQAVSNVAIDETWSAVRFRPTEA